MGKKIRKAKMTIDVTEDVGEAANKVRAILLEDRLSRNYPTSNRNYTIVQKSKKRFLSNAMHIYSQTFLKLQKYHLEECVS